MSASTVITTPRRQDNLTRGVRVQGLCAGLDGPAMVTMDFVAARDLLPNVSHAWRQMTPDEARTLARVLSDAADEAAKEETVNPCGYTGEGACTPDCAADMVYSVTITARLTFPVSFAAMHRPRMVGKSDAFDNALMSGLSDVLTELEGMGYDVAYPLDYEAGEV